MHLLLVESPNKVKKLQGYLDDLYGSGEWSVASTVGHFRGLPKMSGNDLSKVFNLQTWDENFVVQNASVARNISGLACKCDTIYLAADADREGEAIAWHIIEEFGLRDFKRVTFQEITKAAVKAAIDKPIALNQALVEAQRARSTLDYAIGFEVSPKLWPFGAKSAGRVQSAGLRIIVDRENEILAHKPEDYWNITAAYEEGLTASVAAFEQPSDEERDESGDADAPPRLKPKRFASEAEAKALVDAGKDVPHAIESIEESRVSRKPKPPFTTSALLATASKDLKFAAKKTTDLAQKLFEKGMVTYIRTDSVALSPEAVADIRMYLKDNHEHLLPAESRSYTSGSGAQEAHEAIRPTMMTADAKALTVDERLLYDLIWTRTLMCQSIDAISAKTVLTIRPGALDWRLLATATVGIEPGWLTFQPKPKATKKTKSTDDDTLPRLSKGQTLRLKSLKAKGAKTKPKPRFTEGAFVAYLERKGIGRPATYSTILTTLADRQYVNKVKDRLVPQETGFLCDRLLRQAFDALTQEGFTKATEKALDKIAKGKLERVPFLTSFYENLQKMLGDADAKFAEYAKRHPELHKDYAEKHDKPCEKCKSPMTRRKGRYGLYAQCDSTECGARVNLEPLKEIKEPCPICGGTVVEQPYMKGNTKKLYFRCLNGDWSANSKPLKPIKEKCPTCHGAVVEQPYKKEGKARSFFRCQSDCGWKSNLRPPIISKWPCHVDREHGDMMEFSGKSARTKKKYTYWLCMKCDEMSSEPGSTKVWSGPKPPTCGECRKKMSLREGRDGPFWGCTGYPDCKYTLPLN